MPGPASGMVKLRITVSPAATPAAGTVTDRVVPVAVAALVPIVWTNAIWALALPSAASSRLSAPMILRGPVFMLALLIEVRSC